MSIGEGEGESGDVAEFHEGLEEWNVHIGQWCNRFAEWVLSGASGEVQLL